MKMWLELDEVSWAGPLFAAHLVEPTHYDSHDSLWDTKGGCACVELTEEDALTIFGKKLPKGNELFEFDLSGKKPRFVCVWEPCAQ
jgi:hypothetical protein